MKIYLLHINAVCPNVSVTLTFTPPFKRLSQIDGSSTSGPFFNPVIIKSFKSLNIISISISQKFTIN